jgi:hypothetical protein
MEFNSYMLKSVLFYTFQKSSYFPSEFMFHWISAPLAGNEYPWKRLKPTLHLILLGSPMDGVVWELLPASHR